MVRIGGSTEKGEHIKESDYYTPSGEFRFEWLTKVETNLSREKLALFKFFFHHSNFKWKIAFLVHDFGQTARLADYFTWWWFLIFF